MLNDIGASLFDLIFTNPPWSKIRAFLNKGMEISDNIVYLAPVNHFITKARLRDIYTSGFKIHEIYCVSTPKINWPQSGFQLAAVHLTKTDVGLSNIVINGEIGK